VPVGCCTSYTTIGLSSPKSSPEAAKLKRRCCGCGGPLPACCYGLSLQRCSAASKSRCATCKVQNEKYPKITISDFNRFFFCLLAHYGKLGSDMKLMVGLLPQLIQKRHHTASVDLLHVGGYHIQMPILHPDLRSEKFLIVRLVQALQLSLLLCSRHTNLCISRWSTWALGSPGIQMWKPRLRMTVLLQHGDVGKAAYAAEVHHLHRMCKGS